MNTSTYSESFLLGQFRAFYAEVIRLKQMVASGRLVFSSETGSEEIEDPVQAAHFVAQRLLALLELQIRSADLKGEEYSSAIVEDARYVMATLADEVFLHLDWVGKTAWGADLLESRLFRSHGAGEVFFGKLDRLLQNRDPLYTELARIYLMALALGFQGKFRGTGDSRELDAYRRKLFSYIARREPDLLDSSRDLFPNAYAYTLDEGVGRRLPHLRLWLGALVVATGVWITIGHLIWVANTAELDQVIQQILGR